MSDAWIDPHRGEIYSADPADHRELVVWIWYPASSPSNSGSAQPAPYLPESWAAVGQPLGLDVANVRTHAVADAPVADSDTPLPVLVLSPSGFSPLLLAATAEELASHGYVVVGVNHTYETAVTVFPDGRVVPINPDAIAGALGPQTGSHDEVFGRRAAVCDYKAADLATVADQLARINGDARHPLNGRLDLGRLAALGHSFGGDAALEWCRLDSRCRATANLDGAIWTRVGRVGLSRPALQLLAPHAEFDVSPEQAVTNGMAPDTAWFEAEKAITFGGWRTIQDNARPAYTIRIEGASHLSFMDVPFLPVRSDSPVKPMLAATAIDATRMWRIINDALLAFFGRHLAGPALPLLDGDTHNYPEVTLGPA